MDLDGKIKEGFPEEATYELLNLVSSLREFLHDFSLLGEHSWHLQGKYHFFNRIATFYLEFERRR